MSLSTTAADALFASPPASWFVYFRPGRRSPWQLVGTATSHAEAVGLIGAGGRRGGDWLVTQVSVGQVT
ncbi:MAG: hypothetical protein U0804_16030 [Gemmataceae bacterium]